MMDDDPMNQNDWQCEACGGQGGHNEGCRGEASLVIENGNLRATIQQLEAQLNDKDTVPRSRYNVCCDQYNEVRDSLTNVRRVAKTEIQRLEARLAESEKAAYDIDETIQHQKQTIEQFEARVKELESIAPPCRWRQDDAGSEVWKTACGKGCCFEDGGPVENHVNWCHYCGGKVELDSSHDSVG